MGADDDVSWNTISVEMIGKEDENSAKSVWPDYWIDAPIEEDSNRKVGKPAFKFLCLHFLKTRILRIFAYFVTREMREKIWYPAIN